MSFGIKIRSLILVWGIRGAVFVMDNLRNVSQEFALILYRWIWFLLSMAILSVFLFLGEKLGIKGFFGRLYFNLV